MGLMGLMGLMVGGCAAVKPGADAFVVRTEQAQTVAAATFDFVLRMDQANRGMWQTNAPAFHDFCEWLRTPTAYGAALNVPRCVVMQLQVDDLKLSYQAAKTAGNSNALFLAVAVLGTAVNQSASWSNIVTAPVR